MVNLSDADSEEDKLEDGRGMRACVAGRDCEAPMWRLARGLYRG